MPKKEIAIALVILLIASLFCSSGNIGTGGAVNLYAQATPLTTLTVSVGDKIEVEIQSIATANFHTIGFDVMYPAILAPVIESGKPKYTAGDLFTGKVSTDAVSWFESEKRLYITRALAKTDVAESGNKSIIKLQFQVVSTGGQGTVQIANQKAFIYDSGQTTGFASLPTSVENLVLVFNAPVPVGLVTIKIIARKL